MPPEGPPPQEPGRPTTLRPRPPGRSRTLLWTLGIVAVVLVLFVLFTGYYSEWLWFRSLGFSSVFSKQLTTRLLLFGFFGLLMAASLAFTMWLAHRLRPAFRGMTQEQQNLERYRVSLEPVRRRVVIGVSVLFGLLAGGTAAGQWRQYLLFANSQPFGVSDPQFGTDVSFYAFRLPFLRYLVGFGFATAFLCLVTAAVVHYLYGGIKLQSPGERFTPAARAHLSVLLGVFVLLKMASLLAGPLRPGHQGRAPRSPGRATPTSTRSCRPRTSSCGSRWSARCCSSPTSSGARGSCPVLGAGPAHPVGRGRSAGSTPRSSSSSRYGRSENIKESPYIQRNITATRESYGLAGIQEEEYQATSTPTAARTGRRPQHRRQRPPPRPGRRLADLPAGPADPRVLRLRRPARRRPLHDQRRRARRRRRGARDRLQRPPAGQQNFANLHTPTPTASASSAPTATPRPSTASRTSSRTTCRTRARSTSTSRASTSARTRRSTRSSAGRRDRTRRSWTSPTTRARRARPTTPTPVRAASPVGSSVQPAAVRRPVPGEATSCSPTW